MPRFPSAEWATAFREAINANPEYAEAAQAWEGDVMLLIAPDSEAPDGEGIHLDLEHGTCRAAEYLTKPGTVQSEFVYRGTRADWHKLLRKQIDPVQAILDGTFHLKGNLAKAMRFTRAAKALIETATAVPTTN
jgi:putative sterol carrier protein